VTAPAATAPLAPSTTAIESQASVVANTSLQSQVAVAAYVSQFGQNEEGWYDTSAITEMVRHLAHLTDNFGTSAARFADQFTADAVAQLTGKRYRAVGVRNTTGLSGEKGVREGISTEGLFGRTADRYRYQQSLLDQQFIADVQAGVENPTELASPLDVAVDRAKRAAQINVQLATRNQAVATMADAARRDLIIGYRRVLHAELAHEGSCGLCVADSTRIYRANHLLPMHPGCHCIPVPISERADPGAAINDRDLGRFYGDAGGTSAQKLRETRYKVDDHGEIGPVLRPFGAPIRTAEEARRDTNRPRRAKTDVEKARTLRARRDKLDRAMQKAPMTPTPAWKTRMDQVGRRIDRLDREIVKLGG